MDQHHPNQTGNNFYLHVQNIASNKCYDYSVLHDSIFTEISP